MPFSNRHQESEVLEMVNFSMERTDIRILLNTIESSCKGEREVDHNRKVGIFKDFFLNPTPPS